MPEYPSSVLISPCASRFNLKGCVLEFATNLSGSDLLLGQICCDRHTKLENKGD